MDPIEKKRLRDHIGAHMDLQSARLSDGEAIWLRDFIDEYDERYRGRTISWDTYRDDLWSSEGKYTREETYTYTFTDNFSIRRNYQCRDDGVPNAPVNSEIKDVRGILNWFRDNGNRLYANDSTDRWHR